MIDLHLITAQEARDLASAPFRKYYTDIENIARCGIFQHQFDYRTKSPESVERFNSLIEDLKKRGYEVEVEFSSEWKEDRYGDAIEGSVFTLNRVTVKW